MIPKLIQLFLKTLALTSALLIAQPAWANEVDDLLTQKEPIIGVVFEIVSGDKKILDQLLPTIKKDIKRLRARHPKLPIAIVSHGKEQFALMTENQTKDKKAHSLVKELVTKNDVEVHVCETHAGWYDKAPEDYPDYIDVAASGPEQINNYEELGYDLVVLP